MNKPNTKLGMDFRLFFAVIGVGVLVFLACSLLHTSKLPAPCLVAVLFTASWLLTKKDPKLIHLFVMSLLQAAHYDPGKK